MPERSVFDELAEKIRGMAGEEAKRVSPPVTRGKVKSADPLIVVLPDDIVIEEGDPDVEFEKRLLGADRPEEGDTVRVHHDGQDWIVGGVVE
jgi:hypothetical protein